MSSKALKSRHLIRQRSPLTLAAVCGVTALVLLASLAWSWADHPQPMFVAWVLLVMAVVWSLFVRPAVLLDEDGVTIRNVFTDIHIPWVRVTDVEFRWNLKVFVGDRGYLSWAISSQVERPKGATAGMFGGLMSGGLDKYASTDAPPPTSAPKVTAPMVGRLIEQAKEDYFEAVARGELPAAPDGQVQVIWVPVVFAILFLPTIAVLVLSLT